MNTDYSLFTAADPSAIVAPMATTKTIELRTDIPGPRSREILDRKERVVADPSPSTSPS